MTDWCIASVHDRGYADEIELLVELMVIASASDGRLSQTAIDRVLKVGAFALLDGMP